MPSSKTASRRERILSSIPSLFTWRRGLHAAGGAAHDAGSAGLVVNEQGQLTRLACCLFYHGKIKHFLVDYSGKIKRFAFANGDKLTPRGGGT